MLRARTLRRPVLKTPIRAAGVALLAAVLAAVLAGCAQVAKQPAELAPQSLACPTGLPDGTRCLGGRDSAGAHYLIAMPAVWNTRG